jgi:hypothetical protein
MKRKILLWLIQKLHRLTYEPTILDKVNKKLIQPVPGLIIDGVQYYEFVSLADMPHMRMVHYSYMREEMVMGIDRQTQLTLISKIKGALKDSDLGAAQAFLFMFEDMLANITTIESLYNVASVIYFDDKEDIATYDHDYNQQKIKRFKSIKDKSFFFFYLLQSSLKVTADKMPRDMQTFLNENAVKLNTWMSILSEPTESISSERSRL